MPPSFGGTPAGSPCTSMRTLESLNHPASELDERPDPDPANDAVEVDDPTLRGYRDQ